MGRRAAATAAAAGIWVVVASCGTDPHADLPKAPDAGLTVNGTRQTAALGTYCWRVESRGICADAELITPADPIAAPTTFTAQFELGLADELTSLTLDVFPIAGLDEQDSPGDDIRSWRQVSEATYHTEIVPASAVLELSLEPGSYAFRLYARWGPGLNAAYGFLVEVND